MNPSYIVPIKTLLERGVHFGHRASRWNPKMAPYIHGKRNQIHISDLKETLRGLLRAAGFLERLSADGKQVLMVGTKRQAQTLIRETAEKLGMPYVTERWLGGTLTNFQTIRSRLRRLEELEAMEAGGGFQNLSKREIARLLREKRKIARNLEGIRNMQTLPGALLIIDPKKEKTAVKEARRMGIPSLAILDTDCDPETVDIPIPGNDDALRSLQVLTEKLALAISNGRQAHAQFLAEEERRRSEEEAKKLEAKKAKIEQQKRKAAEQLELDKVLKKAREERAKRQAEEAAREARGGEDSKPAAGDAAPEAVKTEAPVGEKAPKGETKPGPMGPEPVEG